IHIIPYPPASKKSSEHKSQKEILGYEQIFCLHTLALHLKQRACSATTGCLEPSGQTSRYHQCTGFQCPPPRKSQVNKESKRNPRIRANFLPPYPSLAFETTGVQRYNR